MQSNKTLQLALGPAATSAVADLASASSATELGCYVAKRVVIAVIFLGLVQAVAATEVIWNDTSSTRAIAMFEAPFSLAEVFEEIKRKKQDLGSSYVTVDVYVEYQTKTELHNACAWLKEQVKWVGMRSAPYPEMTSTEKLFCFFSDRSTNPSLHWMEGLEAQSQKLTSQFGGELRMWQVVISDF